VFPLQHIYDEVTKEFGLRSTSQGPQIEL
jgi:hypothetical protein